MLFIQMRIAIHLLMLAQIWGALNPAKHQPATQSGDYEDYLGVEYSASRAVDGNTSTFSHTEPGRDANWWRVNLGAKYTLESIRIYNRGGPYNDLLRGVSILTSNSTQPNTPSLTSNDWTRVTYEESAYGEVYDLYFERPIDGQYVAVYNEQKDGMALTEVEVYDYNFALYKPTDSSSNQADAPKATDGDLSTGFSTDQEPSPWWKVNLGETVLLREVLVFLNAGTQLTKAYFLTNPSGTATEPNTAENDGWNKCRHSEQIQEDYYSVECNQGYTYPLTRLFSITCSAITRIQLRQVEIYGFELPQLSGNIDGKADSATSTSVTVSFLPWDQTMTGGSPPTGYRINTSGGESETVTHNFGSQRLNTTFNGLDPWKTYIFTVSCTIQGIACTGSTHSFTASTSCAVPDKPGEIAMSAAKKQHDNRERWEYTATWEAPNKANCAGSVQYQYSLAGEFTSSLQTTTTATFYLDGDQPFEFNIKAKNSVGFSTLRSISGSSGVLKPQFGSDRISVTAKNSTCVTYTWSEPLYPGGTISRYQHRCSGESWMDAGGDVTKDSCGHQPYTQITCWVRAKNSAGWGTTTSAGRTDCDVPTPPQDVNTAWVEVEHSGRNRWRLTSDWKAPNRANCNGVIQYKYGIQGEPTSTLQSGMSVAYYLEGNQSYDFVVQAKNSIGFSAKTSEIGRTDPLAPQFGTSQISVTETSSECVKLSWTEPQYPGGSITQYQYYCSDSQWINLGSQITNKESCGHEPYTDVTCRFRAGNIAGFSDVQIAGARTLCAAPSYNLSSFANLDKTATIEVTLQALPSYCPFLGQYEISITDDNGQLFYKQVFNSSGYYAVNNATAFTNYTVTVAALYSAEIRSESVKTILTEETAPTDGPTLQLTFTDSCVLLHIQPPDLPNGVIFAYEYRCGEYYGRLRENIQILAQDINEGVVLSSCNFTQATKVTCTTYAVNGIGQSPESTSHGYTHATVLAATGPVLLPPDASNPKLVVIQIYPVELEDTSFSIRTYKVLLTKLIRNETSAVESCDDGKCYTAEIESELVTADGYRFYIGDGKSYGGYVNSALEPNSSYSVHIVISVQIPEVADTIHQMMQQDAQFTAPSLSCPSPPMIDNALVGPTKNAAYGETIVYTCDVGYHMTGGDFQLTCTLTDSYESVWAGSLDECEKDPAQPTSMSDLTNPPELLPTYIGVASIAVAVVVLFGISWRRYHHRKRGLSSLENGAPVPPKHMPEARESLETDTERNETNNTYQAAFEAPDPHLYQPIMKEIASANGYEQPLQDVHNRDMAASLQHIDAVSQRCHNESQTDNEDAMCDTDSRPYDYVRPHVLHLKWFKDATDSDDGYKGPDIPSGSDTGSYIDTMQTTGF